MRTKRSNMTFSVEPITRGANPPDTRTRIGRTAAVRELEFDDCEGVAALLRDVGWSVPTRADWERLWLRNPATEGGGPRLSRGWVLLNERRPVGCLYNIEQRYQLGAHTIRAAVAASLVVAPGFRGRTMQLLTAFSRQPHPDLLLNTTASAQAQKLFEFAKFERIPQPDYDSSLCWVLRATGFARAAMRKRGWGPIGSGVGGVLAAPAISAWSRRPLNTVHALSSNLHVAIRDVASIGREFDALWSRKLAEGRRLLAHRTSVDLRWHFGRPRPGLAAAPFLVCAYRGPDLIGYAAVVRQDSTRFGLKRARVADLIVLEDDAGAIRRILRSALLEARRQGAEMLELIGFPSAIRAACSVGRPLKLAQRCWPFLYKTVDPELKSELRSSAAWYACLYDGDGAL